MKAHKVVPSLLMATGLTVPVAATAVFLSHVGANGLTAAAPKSAQSNSGKRNSTPSSGTGTGSPPPRSSVSGTFTGPAAPGYFGPVQATLIVQSGKITNVRINAPKDNPTSAYINSAAVPLLRNETLHAQSARINGVSGATVTSEFYYQSLVGALKKAHL